jgi:serine/threonine-protein kinase PpkA
MPEVPATRYAAPGSSEEKPMKRRTFVLGSMTAGVSVSAPGFGQLVPAPPAAPSPMQGQAAQAAGDRQALLMEGKRSLRQRVLTRPDATPRASAGGAPGGAALPTLTVLYVYARPQTPDGKNWAEVGRASHGQTLGFLPADDVIDWPHTMTAVFVPPGNRKRTLFFRERDTLVSALSGDHLSQSVDGLIDRMSHPPVPADFPVLAVEPDTYIDPQRQFYLLPILHAEKLTLQSGREHKVLEVASVPILSTPARVAGRFSLDIAFLMDTTLSMDPYIERVRNALNDVVRAMAAEGDVRTRFALIGFRNSLEVQPRLEYLTKIFAKFADSTDPAGFARKIAEVRATDADSLNYDEDSFAGVMTAINDLDWGDGGRLVVLVTDAASRGPNDAHSSTHLDAAALNRLATEKHIAINVLHLRTPAGRDDHANAEAQYSVLARYPGLPPGYFPVANGDVDALNRVVRQMIPILRQAAHLQSPAPPPAAANPQDPGARLELLTHVLRLEWLGRQGQAAVPNLIRAWVADTYSEQGDSPPVSMNLEIRVLLTRNQLSDLDQALRLIIEQGRGNMLDSNMVFERLQGLAAHVARDPEDLQRRGLQTLGDLLGEYLDDLPYVSLIAGLDRDRWLHLGPSRQNEILDTLESHRRAYKDFDRTPELWVSFDGGADPGEAMHAVPLDLLP